MIRKCQRLANTNPVQAPTLSFRTVYAPTDFRLKEMERWLKDQGAKIGKPDAPQHNDALYDIQGDHRHDHKRSSIRSTSTTPAWDQQRRLSGLSVPEPPLLSNPAIPHSPTSSSDAGPDGALEPPFIPGDAHRLSPIPEQTQIYSSVPDRTLPAHLQPQYTGSIQPQHTGNMQPQYTGGSIPLPGTVASPEPLPVPYRNSLPTMVAPANFVNMPVADPAMNMPAPQPTGMTMQPDDDMNSTTSRPGLTRRRSSLKRSGSLSRMSIVSQAKNVAWAMDHSQFELAAREVELAGWQSHMFVMMAIEAL
jgi:hypothetical protein